MYKDLEKKRAKFREYEKKHRDRWPSRSPEARRAAHARAKERDPIGFARRRRSNTLKKKYGITVVEYEALYESQKGLCAVCGNNFPMAAGRKGLHVDHSHSTGRIRGLLCHGCNIFVGYLEKMEKEPQRFNAAVAYIERGRG